MTSDLTVNKKLKAYTLFELLVVMGIILIISFIVIPYSFYQTRANSARSQASDLTSLIYTLEQDAYSGKGSASYGIAFTSSGYTVFTGTNSSSTTQKDTTALPSNLSITLINLTGGATETVFSPNSLKPTKSGTVRISDQSVTYEINLTSEGYIEYYNI